MGARIFLDKSVDVNAVGNAAAARLSDPKNKEFAKIFIKALQEYGMTPLDGTGGGSNVYFEGDATANWTGLIGAKNSYGSYNDISRAVAAVLPWTSLRVADASVFSGYATSNGSSSTPSPAPSPSPVTTPTAPIVIPGANTTKPVTIPVDLPVQQDGTVIADFTGDGINEVAKDNNNDGAIDPSTELVIPDDQQPGIDGLLDNEEPAEDIPGTISTGLVITAGPFKNATIPKPVAYTFVTAQVFAISGLASYLAITKLAFFAGLRGKLGL